MVASSTQTLRLNARPCAVTEVSVDIVDESQPVNSGMSTQSSCSRDVNNKSVKHNDFITKSASNTHLHALSPNILAVVVVVQIESR